MDFESAKAVLADVPFTGPYKGKFFYELVKGNAVRDVLELGWAHGPSSWPTNCCAPAAS